MDDEELLAATAAGDANAFAVFYRRHLGLVVGFGVRATGDREAAADLSAFGPNVQYSVFPLSSGGSRRRRANTLGSPPADRQAVWASVVPDGVASVSWTFDCGGLPQRFGGCAGLRSRTFTLPSVDNVAALQVPSRWNCTGCSSPDQVTWRSADGRVVASFSGRTGNLAAPPFVKGGRGPRILRVLHPSAVGNARLGQDSSTATHTLAQLLGPPADANVRTGGCGIDHESVWTSPAVSEPLTIFEHAGRFVGYRYGAPVNEIGLQPGPGAVLATRGGLTLDDTVKVARRIYGTAFTTYASDGDGSWRTISDGGTLGGSVLPTTYPLRVVTGRNPIATIHVGDTGCPPAGS